MEYDLTVPERKAYLATRGKTVVTACPGSGKTTSIVFKLRTICNEVEKCNCRAGVLCLSFTNKAVDEIKNAYEKIHGEVIKYPHEVSTIDSFLTQYIVMPYWYLDTDCKSRPTIVNDQELLHKYLWRKYTINGKEKDVCCIGKYGSIPSIYKPEEISYVDGKYYCGTSLLKDNLQYAQSVVEYRKNHGILTSSDALNVALSILNNNTQIADIICRRFPYIIVDEAQDTSANQYRLLFALLKVGLKNIEFVGDVNQSIYEWRFARPDMLEKLKDNKDWNHIEFVNNRRSVQRIIDFYSNLIPAAKRTNVISVDVIDKKIPILVYRYDSSNASAVISDFERICKDNHLNNWLIMTRGRSLGMILSGNREAPEYWKSPIPLAIIKAYLHFFSGEVKKSLIIMSNVWAHLAYSDDDYEKKKLFVEEIINDYEKTSLLVDLFFGMPTLDETYSSWNVMMSKYLKAKLSLKDEPVFEVFKYKKKGPKIDEIANMTLSMFYGTGLTNNQVGRMVQTIHSTKGASTDAVLLFLGDNSKGKAVSLNDFKTSAEMSEKQRMLYVSCSRARQFLAIAVPLSFTEEKIRSIMKGFSFEFKTP